MSNSKTEVIIYGGKEFPLEHGMTLKDAKALMARFFPELADPKVETRERNGRKEHVFTKQAGRKGAGADAVVKCMRALKPVRATPVLRKAFAAITRDADAVADPAPYEAMLNANRDVVTRLLKVPALAGDVEVL